MFINNYSSNETFCHPSMRVANFYVGSNLSHANVKSMFVLEDSQGAVETRDCNDFYHRHFGTLLHLYIKGLFIQTNQSLRSVAAGVITWTWNKTPIALPFSQAIWTTTLCIQLGLYRWPWRCFKHKYQSQNGETTSKMLTHCVSSIGNQSVRCLIQESWRFLSRFRNTIEETQTHRVTKDINLREPLWLILIFSCQRMSSFHHYSCQRYWLPARHVYLPSIGRNVWWTILKKWQVSFPLMIDIFLIPFANLHKEFNFPHPDE